MRWRASLLAVQGLLVGATGWGCDPLPILRAWSHPRRPASRGQHQEQKLPQQRAEFKAIRRRRALLTAMTAAADGGGGCGSGDGPSMEYNWDAWQRRASRAMKFVSMPIVKKAGQPREQVGAPRKWGQLSSFQSLSRSRREGPTKEPCHVAECKRGGRVTLPGNF